MSGLRHQKMASGAWWSLTLCEQMGHIGSEVSRALNWRGRNPAISQGALERALELIDLTLADPRHLRSVPRLREIARAREVLLDFMVGPNQYGSNAHGLRRYFDIFAMAAVRARAGG